MARPKLSNSSQPFLIRSILIVYEFLASLKLAVVLIFSLAVILGLATFVESHWGTAAARWYIYHTGWFAAVMALLGVNIFCAAAIRFPWKRHQTGFVITHLGLLILLAGSAVSFRSSLNSQMLVFKGDHSEFAIDQDYGFLEFENLPGEDGPVSVPFHPGPFNWNESEPIRLMRTMKSVVGLDDVSQPWQHPAERIYQNDKVAIDIVDFYARSEMRQLPCVKLQFRNPGIGAEMPIELEFLELVGGAYAAGFAREDFGGIGTVVFWSETSPQALDAFKQSVPETAIDEQTAKDGALVVWVDGEPEQVRISQLQALRDRGEAFELDSGYRLALADYRSRSVSPPTREIYDRFPWKYLDQVESGLIPIGPRVTVELTPPESESPIEVTRLADAPFFNDAELPENVRLEFWHPESPGRVDILEGPNRQLACRVWQQKIGRVVHSGDLATGEEIDTWSTGGDDRIWKMTLQQYIPRDEYDAVERTRQFAVRVFDRDAGKTTSESLTRHTWIAPLPLPFDKDNTGDSRQVRIRITPLDGAGDPDTFWLRQTLPPPWMTEAAADIHETQLAGTEVQSSYKAKETDVGFTLKLVEFDLDVDPGTQMAGNYTSYLARIDVRKHEDIVALRKQMKEASGVEREELRAELLSRRTELVADILEKLDGQERDAVQQIADDDPAVAYQEITMNRPMDYPDWRGRMLRFFQENYLPPNALAGHPELGSIFRVNYDPGRLIKGIGNLLIVFGIFMMFYMRAYFFKHVRRRPSSKRSPGDSSADPVIVLEQQEAKEAAVPPA